MSDAFPKSPLPPRSLPSANPFADNLNPYASPSESGYTPQLVSSTDPFAGLWRQGDLLVMHKLAPLPDICLKSNQPATRRLKRTLMWHHPAIYLVILAGVLVYIIVALIIRKTATIHIPLTEEWFAMRRRRMIFAWSTILLSGMLFTAAAANLENQNFAPFAMIAAVFLGLGAAIYGLIACRLVVPQRMTDDYIWLKGINREFLGRLEPWQWNI